MTSKCRGRGSCENLKEQLLKTLQNSNKFYHLLKQRWKIISLKSDGSNAIGIPCTPCTPGTLKTPGTLTFTTPEVIFGDRKVQLQIK